MWRKYFTFVKLVPGRVHISGYGIIDFSKDDISVEVCRKLFESGFPYLEITEEGRTLFYGNPVEHLVPPKKISSKKAELLL